MNRADKLTILIIDDQTEVLEIYEEVLGETLGHHVECVSLPGEALRHVRQRLFDIAIIDAKITHKGASLGGLILAEEVGAVLGVDAVLLMSQYDVRTEVSYFNPSFTFLPKPAQNASLLGWVQKDLMGKIGRLVRRQYGFVIMPYGHAPSDAWYQGCLVPWMEEAGFQVKRMDEMPTSRAINTELQDRIRQSHFVVVYAHQKNSNVYFEAGFATALDKYSIMFAPSLEDLPFDVRANFVLTANGEDEALERAEILRFMQGLRGMDA